MVPASVPLAVLAAVLAAAAVLGWMTSPAARVRAASAARPDLRPSRWPPWVRARPDAPTPLRRGVTAIAAGVGAALAWSSLAGGGWLGWLAAVPTAVAVWVGLGRLEPGSARRRRARLVLDAPAALELLGSCLAAGLPPRNATAAVVAAFDDPVAEDLGRVLAAVDVGVSDAVAWRTLRQHPQFGAAAVDLARCVESGTRMVETLAHHARDARRQRQAALEVRAKAVGVRSVLPLMTCFIPAFLLLGIVPTLVSAISRALP